MSQATDREALRDAVQRANAIISTAEDARTRRGPWLETIGVDPPQLAACRRDPLPLTRFLGCIADALALADIGRRADWP